MEIIVQHLTEGSKDESEKFISPSLRIGIRIWDVKE